ncbi:MAG: hypothetical protein ABIX01_12675 [Chitinophagaceae bacterium]
MPFLSSCKQQEINPIQKKKGFTIEAKSGNWKYENGKNYLAVFTTLTNNSPATIPYVSFSCDWEGAYATDNSNLLVFEEGCDKNFPVTLTLPPQTSEETKLIWLATTADTLKLRGTRFRIGFNYVPFTTPENLEKDANKLFEHSNMIWSDTLTLK